MTTQGPRPDGDGARRAPVPAATYAVPPVIGSPEWLSVTLANIGDAVIATDAHGLVTFLNPVAQALTGWTQEQAVSIELEKVLRLIHEETRAPVENPALKALRE